MTRRRESRAERSVVFFVTELGRGGAETQLLRIALGLRRRGWRVSVVSLMPPVGYRSRLEEAGARVFSLGLSRGRPRLAAVWRAAAIVRAARPDVICCFLYHATLLGASVSKLTGGAPVVSSIRDPSFGGERRLRLVGGLLRLGLVKRIVANSETVASALRTSRRIDSARLAVIPNGLAISEAPLLSESERQTLRLELGVAEAEFLWLHVGNFQAPKDHPGLLRAFAEVARSRPDARLRLVGLGNPDPGVAAQLRDLRGSVDHLGERNDVPRLMEAADALVLSSTSEGLPNVIMEAYAARTPVVSTRVGGVGELVTHEASGLLVPPADADSLAGAMVRMMEESAETRERWATEGHDHVRATYALERIVDRWEAFFEEVTGAAVPF